MCLLIYAEQVISISRCLGATTITIVHVTVTHYAGLYTSGIWLFVTLRVVREEKIEYMDSEDKMRIPDEKSHIQSGAG